MRITAVFVLTATFLSASAHAVEVTASGLFNPLGYIAGVNVEVSGGDATGLELSASYLEYEYEETGYYETGDGPIVGVRGRFYPQAGVQRSQLWLGAGLSGANITTYWEERESGVLTDSDEKTNLILTATGGVGYKALLGGGKFVFDPQLFVGILTNAETDTNVIAGLGFAAGVRF